MELDLWAQLNLVGHVSYGDYCNMTRDEAIACLEALNRVIDEAKQKAERQRSFDDLVNKYKVQ